MRLSCILIIVLFSATTTISYAQNDIETTRVQAMSIIKQIGLKYSTAEVPASVSSGQSVSSIPLLEQISKTVVNSKMFEGAYRASKSILAGTEGGVSYRDYGNLVQPLLAEASILKDTAITPEEKLLAQTYVDAADIYAATGRLWSATLGYDVDAQSAPWALARTIVTSANEAYLRSYRLELSPQPQPTPSKKAKRSSMQH
jgi:hypothetical protein